MLDYEDSYPNSDAYRLRKYYYYSSAATNPKVLTRTLHRFYEGSATTDYETRYYTDSFYGRPKGIGYPGGVGVAYVYNAGGYLVQEKDASSSYVIRQVTARDARNQVQEATLADGDLSYAADYYPATGQMKAITVTGASGAVHALDYTYDGYGNLHTQTKVYAGGTASETFWYDDLHRLQESDRSWPGGSQIINYDYDPAGNLTLKDDYATAYAYTGSRPNAVSSITKVGSGTATFTYDASGNRLTGDGKTLAYTAFNRPATITAGGVTASFAYGADLARYRQDKSTGETILYIDKLMEIVQDGGSTEYRHYLGDVAILTKTGGLDDPYPAVSFLHRDRLGSVVTITDENGEAEARGYDPFGKPREPDGANKVPPVLGSAITDRGFTDHEHLDASQLIHMNGRVYDYNLGRFLSVDPLIQAPGHSQSLNPYSYIMNNPLAGIDPSGFSCGTRINTNGAGSMCSDPYGNVRANVTVTGDKANIHLTGGNGAQQQAAQNAIVRAFEAAGYRQVDQIGSQHSNAGSPSLVCTNPAQYQYSQMGPSDTNVFADIARADIPFASRALNLIDASLAPIHGLKIWLDTGEYVPVGPLTNMMPTDEELQTAGIASLLATGPAGMSRSMIGKGAVSLADDIARGIPKITESGLARIEQHLSRPALKALDDPANAAMLQRLRSGSTSPQDVNFYLHELKESSLMKRGLDARDAHLGTLKWQGIPYEAGYESQLYAPEVIEQFPELFNPAAWAKK
ncbi:MAG TPA: RHS repeat-associated core domain-containing protein [Woeseiaceae bacterium]